MKIAFISYEDSNDISAWSGTISFMAKYLEKDNELVRVDNLAKPIDFFFRGLSYLMQKLGKSSDFKRNRLFVKTVCNRIQKKIDSLQFDLIFAPGSTYITYIKTNKPIVIWADATYNSILETHFQYKNLTKRQISIGNKLEQIAFDNADKLIFASSKVAISAKKEYKIDNEKINIIPFGANLNHSNTSEDIIKFNYEKSKSKVHLLFIGVYWHSKGGDILLEIFKELNLLSDIYYLDIVGSSPDNFQFIEKVSFHGFLDKSIPKQKNKLDSIFKSAHYFVLPTRSEAYGISFVEANSYGLPAFGSNLGGVPDIIKNGVNGELIDITKSPIELAEQIHNYIINGDYNEKSLRAFNHYNENFTWDKSIEKVNRLIEEVIIEDIK